MTRKTIAVAILIFCTISLQSFSSENTKLEDRVVTIEIPEDFHLSIASGIQYDIYLQAYLKGSLDAQFPGSNVIVTVRNGDILLSNLPEDNKKPIIAYVNEFVTKSSVSPNQVIATSETTKNEEILPEKKSYDGGIWLPQSSVLYQPELANPLRVCFSGGIRFHDAIAGQVSTPVSFGDQFPIYRWSNVDIWKFRGDLQLEAEGSIFAVFNQTRPSSPLINADYYVGIPVSYAYDQWVHRARIYHISSHLGDEYMKRRHHAKRLNKSFEAVDYSLSYYITRLIRLYGGVGVIAHSDSEMRLKPLYADYGMEVHIGRHEWQDLYGTPFLAMHFQNFQDLDYDIDANFAIGYEWGKINGLGKKVRVTLEYHSGFCGEGQFSRIRCDYTQIRLSYGF